MPPVRGGDGAVVRQRSTDCERRGAAESRPPSPHVTLAAEGGAYLPAGQQQQQRQHQHPAGFRREKSAQVDDEFVETMMQVETRFHSLPKHLRIRCELWAKKLCQVYANEVFQRNRNAYADLLLQCIVSGSWQEPFDRLPSDGPLPQLPKHLAHMARQRRLEEVADRLSSSSRHLPDTSRPELMADSAMGMVVAEPAAPSLATSQPEKLLPLRGSSRANAEAGAAEASLRSQDQNNAEQSAQQCKWAQARAAKLELENRCLRKQLKTAQHRAAKAEKAAEQAAARAAVAEEQATVVLAKAAAASIVLAPPAASPSSTVAAVRNVREASKQDPPPIGPAARPEFTSEPQRMPTPGAPEVMSAAGFGAVAGKRAITQRGPATPSWERIEEPTLLATGENTAARYGGERLGNPTLVPPRIEPDDPLADESFQVWKDFCEARGDPEAAGPRRQLDSDGQGPREEFGPTSGVGRPKSPGSLVAPPFAGAPPTATTDGLEDAQSFLRYLDGFQDYTKQLLEDTQAPAGELSVNQSMV